MKQSIAYRLAAGVVFIIAFAVFFSTMAPSVSFWDCGEYIASSHILGIPHPPGNPFYIMLGRFFSILLGGTDFSVAQRINLISVLSASFSALFIFLIIGRVLRATWGDPDTWKKWIITVVSGMVGAFFGVFNYTFWFSAVEASVYIPSILTILINIYIALVWAQSKDTNRDRYLLLFTYVAFLGVGIHMMALFALIPVMAYVMVVDPAMRRDWRLWCVALLLGSVAYGVSAFIFIAPLLLVITLIYAYVPLQISRVVNVVLALSAAVATYMNGDIMSIIVFSLLAAVTLVALFSKEKHDVSLRKWRFAYFLVLFSLLGYSVHIFIPIRSAKEPAINENHPTVRWGNDKRAVKALEDFKEGLSAEVTVQKSYKEFLRAVENASATADAWDRLKNSLMKSEMSPAQAYASFTAAVDSTAVEKYRSNFSSALEKHGAMDSAYNSYIDAVKADMSSDSIEQHYEQFISKLREDKYASVRDAFLAYIRNVRESSRTGEAYRSFVLAKKNRKSSTAWASFMEELAKVPRAQSAYDAFRDDISQYPALEETYGDFVAAVKENSNAALAEKIAFETAVENFTGPVNSAYNHLMTVVSKDSLLDRLHEDYIDDVKLNYVAEDKYEAFTDALAEDEKGRAAWKRFQNALAAAPGLGEQYRRFETAMEHVSLTDIHWDDFRNFLERKQYGSESMITRMFHRRGALTRQFGFDGHMGFLGFHLTQFFHFNDDINTDRRGSSADENYDKGARSSNSVLGTPFPQNFFYLLLYLIPTAIALWGIFFWYSHNRSATVLLVILFGTTTIAFGLYMNFADGTRADSRRDIKRQEDMVARWEDQLEQYERYREQAFQNPNVDVGQVEQVIRQLKNNKPTVDTVHREVRIRDYFYTAGFVSFGLWLGLAVAGILYILFYSSAATISGVAAPAAALVFLFSPLLPLTQNYAQNDRTHDWIPYDYAYNLLNSCKEDAILFTSGDNDTFPLWFIQEAAGVRTDVKVVNFSLLNTKWYIRQLKDIQPRIDLSYSDYDIDTISYSINETGRDLKQGERPEPQTLDKAGLTVRYPTYDEKSYFSVSNKMMLDIVNENFDERPIYFAFGTRRSDLMGLAPYLETQGMVRHLKKSPRQGMDVDRTKYLLDSVYQYRGIVGEDTVWKSETAEKTVRHYVYTYFRFVNELTGVDQIRQAEHRIRQMESHIPQLENSVERMQGNPEQYGRELQQAQQQLTQFRGQKTMTERRLPQLKERLAKNADAGISYMDKAIEILPGFPMSYQVKADIYFVSDQDSLGRETLARGIEMCESPEDKELYQDLYQKLVEAGEIEKAEALMDEAKEQMPAGYEME
ncbi:MAG: protein O-mannosyl-transferase family [Fibrobacterota bacterium]